MNQHVNSIPDWLNPYDPAVDWNGYAKQYADKLVDQMAQQYFPKTQTEPKSKNRNRKLLLLCKSY